MNNIKKLSDDALETREYYRKKFNRVPAFVGMRRIAVIQVGVDNASYYRFLNGGNDISVDRLKEIDAILDTLVEEMYQELKDFREISS